MLGTIINTIAVMAGSIAGMLVNDRLNKRVTNVMMKGFGLCTLIIGIDGALKGENTLIMILSMVVGIFIGETIDIDKHVIHFIEKIEKRFVKNSEKSLSKGFISASLLFCIGSMTIVGCMNAGLSGDNSMLYTKSMLDLCSSMIFASTLGLGVFLASFFVLGYQGLLTLIAMWAAPVFTTHVINEMTCVGSLIIVATGLNLLEITDLKLMNFVPAMFLPILFCMFM